MTRQVKPLEPAEPGHLRFYSCGPTVYSYAHIGNFRTFLTADLVFRTAQALGWRVSYVSNITDVGHLTQDDVADADGEDKMERALRNKDGAAFANIWDLAEHYTGAFVQDWKRLNLLEPLVRPRATQHMREQIVAIQQLVREGHAYETDKGVYFRIASFDEYGKLSGNRDKDSLMQAVRDVLVDDGKENPGDFALWKKDEKHLMQWHSPWGWGFPGWHIECSAMAMAYLGETLDLHAGGEDLVFPHHESEIAQTECLTGKPFSRHWMHVKFLKVDGEKMSKSKGNFFTVRDLIDDQGFDPLALRFALISVPYSKDANFTLQTLRDAAGHIERFRECERRIEAALGEVPEDGEPDAEFREHFEAVLDAMCEDLNTSVALAKTLEGVKAVLREPRLSPERARASAWFLSRVNDLLGVVRNTCSQDDDRKPESNHDAERVYALIHERAEAKRSKDFARADAIREQLAAEGIELRDTPEGTSWVRRA